MMKNIFKFIVCFLGIVAILLPLNAFSKTDIKIISREEWGAQDFYKNGTLENTNIENGDTEIGKTDIIETDTEIDHIVDTDENGEKYLWPLEYAKKIRFIAVHHTALKRKLDNPKEAIRDIQLSHAVKKGWGDIGYHFLIDPQGNIYEGRKGGDYVIGGHLGALNKISVGVAVLGNYEEDSMPYEASMALSNLLDYLTRKYDINPKGSTTYKNQTYPNILGHRDAASTLCPGKNLYRLLPSLRRLVSYKQQSSPKDDLEYKFEITSMPDILHVDPDKTSTFSVKLKNTGTKTWNQETTYLSLADYDKTLKEAISFKDEFKIGVLKETSVLPGAVGTFSVKFSTKYMAGLSAFNLLPVLNGKMKVDNSLIAAIIVNPLNLSYEIVSQSVKTAKMAKGTEKDVTISIKNTGNVSWKKSGDYPVRLATASPNDHISIFVKNAGARVASLPANVKPGETATFSFKITAPDKAGTYKEYYQPVLEGISFMPPQNIAIEIEVPGPKKEERIFAPGESRLITLAYRNTASAAWNSLDFKIFALKRPEIGVENIRLVEKSVLPGKTGHIELLLKAPFNAGKYTVYLRALNFKASFNFTVEETAKPIRIALSFKGDFNGTEAKITGNGLFDLYFGDKKIRTYNRLNTVTVSYENDEYIVFDGLRTVMTSEVVRFVPQGNTILSIPNFGSQYTEYRGVLELRLVDDKFTVINELPLPDYLKGIAEVPNDTPIEKIKTMAVIARSYAKYYMEVTEKFPGKPYNLDDDPAKSQMYRGYSFEKRAPNMVKAVNETRGEVVTYGGKLVKTPYFHQSDGRTRSAQEVWGWTHTPYLQSVPDPYCEGRELQGHGVGLSGEGALEMARNGKTYKEIIKYYYQGVDVSIY